MAAGKSTIANYPEDRKYVWRAYSDFVLPISTTVSCESFILSANSGSGGVNTPTDTTSVGVVQLGTSTSSTGSCAVRTHLALMTLGGGPTTFETGLVIPELSTGVERYIIRAGFSNTATADAANGVYFQYNEAASANWQIVTANASTRTTTATSVAVGTAKTTLKIITNPAGTSAEFFINGASVGTIATNLPAQDVNQTFGVLVNIVKSVGTTARTVDVDWIEATKTYTSPRR